MDELNRIVSDIIKSVGNKGLAIGWLRKAGYNTAQLASLFHSSWSTLSSQEKDTKEAPEIPPGLLSQLSYLMAPLRVTRGDRVSSPRGVVVGIFGSRSQCVTTLTHYKFSPDQIMKYIHIHDPSYTMPYLPQTTDGKSGKSSSPITLTNKELVDIVREIGSRKISSTLLKTGDVSKPSPSLVTDSGFKASPCQECGNITSLMFKSSCSVEVVSPVDGKGIVFNSQVRFFCSTCWLKKKKEA